MLLILNKKLIDHRIYNDEVETSKNMAISKITIRLIKKLKIFCLKIMKIPNFFVLDNVVYF